jgi:hypothetical protein
MLLQKAVLVAVFVSWREQKSSTAPLSAIVVRLLFQQGNARLSSPGGVHKMSRQSVDSLTREFMS